MKARSRLSIGIKGKKGITLTYAVLILVVVSILAASVLAIFNSNLQQEEYQKDYMEAYYLAYSGIQMAFSALAAEDIDSNPNDLFNQLKYGTISSCTQSDIAYGRGSIDINVIMIDDSSSIFDGWIKITATGTLSGSSYSVTRCLFIDPLDQQNVVWDNE